MKKKILNQFIGQKILRVTYFEINHPDQSFFFTGFDNFDLGLEIKLSGGAYWHIGWKEKDRHEIGIGKYNPRKQFTSFKKIDATNKWSLYLKSTIQKFEIVYVNEEWNIPAQCTIQFENSTSASIVLGEELNLDGSLPLPLQYVNGSEIYIFFGKELPPIELVKIILPPKFHEEYVPEFDENPQITTQVFLAIIFILIIVIAIIWKTILDF